MQWATHLFLKLEWIGSISKFFPLLIYSAILRIIFLDYILKLIFESMTNSWNSFTTLFISSLSLLSNSTFSLYNSFKFWFF